VADQIKDDSLDILDKDQSREDQEVVQMVNSLFEKARKARKVKEAKWDENFEFYLGRQWPYRRPTYRHSEVINLVFSAVEQVVPIMNDNRPQIDFIPEDIDDRDLAEAFKKLADSEWTRYGWSHVLTDIIKTGLIYGTAIGALEFDPTIDEPEGKIVFRCVDNYEFYPAPRALDVNDKSCPYIIEARAIPVEEARAMFPELAEKINGTLQSGIPSKFNKTNFDVSLNSNAIRSNEATDDAASAFTNQEAEKLKESLLIKCWIQDDSMEESDIAADTLEGSASFEPDGEKENDKQEEKVLRKKYPNGRYVMIIDNMLAHDDDNPYKDGSFPYARFVDYQIPREFWGMGEVEQLKGPQRMVNRLISFMMDAIVLMGNPIWISDMGSIDTDQVTNQPGLIVEKTPGSDVHREPGVGLPANVLSVYQLAVDAFDRVFGSGEVSQGATPGGVTSGIAIESLQEAAQTRIRQKARNLEKFLNEIGQLYVSRVMQFYNTERLVTIRSENEGLDVRQFKFQIDKDPENVDFYIAKVKEVLPSEEGGSQMGVEKKFRTRGIFDVRATIGSNLPFAKRAKADTAMKLFSLGVLTPRRLLKDLDYPNADEIASELEKQQQAAAQAAAQQQGAPNASG